MHSLSLSLWVQKVLLLFLYSGTRTMHTHTLSRAHIETWTNCAHRLAHSNTSSVPRNTQLWTSHSLFVETSDSKICWSTLTAPTLHSFTHLHALSSLSLSLSIYLSNYLCSWKVNWMSSRIFSVTSSVLLPTQQLSLCLPNFSNLIHTITAAAWAANVKWQLYSAAILPPCLYIVPITIPSLSN